VLFFSRNYPYIFYVLIFNRPKIDPLRPVFVAAPPPSFFIDPGVIRLRRAAPDENRRLVSCCTLFSADVELSRLLRSRVLRSRLLRSRWLLSLELNTPLRTNQRMREGLNLKRGVRVSRVTLLCNLIQEAIMSAANPTSRFLVHAEAI